MPTRFLLIASVVAAGIAAVPRAVPTSAATTEAAAPAPQDHSQTTVDDQVELAVTVYNSDIALVRDVRELRLPRGVADLRFMDIAATVNPATVHFRSLTQPAALDVLEQNYEYDLLEPDKLLRKYVGRDVTLVRMTQQDGTTRAEEVTAHLLSYNTAPVWRIGNEIVTGLHADHIRFPELPENLYARPTLIWTLENGGADRHRVEAAYLAGKLSWNADYVLNVGARRQGRGPGRLGHAHQRQRHGVPQRAPAARRRRSQSRPAGHRGNMMARGTAARTAPAAAAPMAQEAFSEYHLYTLGRKTTINNNETKQVSLLGGTGFPVRKRYVVEGRDFYYHNTYHPGSPDQGRRAGLLPVQERGEEPASACPCRPGPCASIRPTRRAACNSSARIASTTRRRTRR